MRKKTIYFRKGIDFSTLLGMEFSHGSYGRSESHEVLEDFLESLQENRDYVIVE